MFGIAIVQTQRRAKLVGAATPKSWKWTAFCVMFSTMKRDEAISRLKNHETELKQLGVDRLYLFGSTARGDAHDDSDIDLFFDHRRGAVGLFELMDVINRASNILGRKADIMTRASIHPGLRRRIEESAVLVY